MTLIFSGVRAVIKVDVHAKYHQTELMSYRATADIANTAKDGRRRLRLLFLAQGETWRYKVADNFFFAGVRVHCDNTKYVCDVLYDVLQLLL